MIGSMVRDVRDAFHALRRTPMVTLPIVILLGVGIGAVTVVFSIAEGLIFRPLPAVPRIEELITIRARATNGSMFASRPEYQDWRAEARSVSGLAAASLSLFGVSDDDAATARNSPVFGMFVSGNYFSVLAIPPVIGRILVDEDDSATARDLVAVISERFWRGHFDGRGDIVGRRIRVNDKVVTIVGVAAAGFGGTVAGATFDIWVPIESRSTLTPSERDPMDARTTRWLDVIGRRKPQTTLLRVSEEFRTIGASLASRYLESRGRTIEAGPLDTGSAQQLRPLLASLIAVTILVLMIVCSNIASLLLARAAARTREISVRVALGATPLRIFRQVLAENVMLAAGGAAVGVAISAWSGDLFIRLIPSTTIPLDVHAPIDGRVAGVIACLAFATLLTFGIVPALTMSRVRVTTVAGSRVSGGRGRLRSFLVAAQFALTLTTLVCGTLFLRRADWVQRLERGFSDPEHVLLVQTAASASGYSDLDRWQISLNRITERVERVPGVRSTSWATFVPLGYIGYLRRDVRVEDYVPEEGESMRVLVNGVAPRYFDLMGIHVLSGRAIDEGDTPDRPVAAVVNEAFARQYWPAASPIGRHITVGPRALTVVGVVANGRYDYRVFDEPAGQLIYYALRQMPFAFVTLHVRTTGAPTTVAGSVRDAIAAVDPAMTTLPPVSLEEYTALPMTPSRMGVMLLAILSTIGLGLSAIGLHAMVAYGVMTRRREIGIRIALGASSERIVWSFLRQAVVLIVAGVGIGFVGAAGMSLFLRHVVDRLPAADLSSVAAPCVLLLAVGLAAGFFPARHAARVDPGETLRAE